MIDVGGAFMSEQRSARYPGGFVASGDRGGDGRLVAPFGEKHVGRNVELLAAQAFKRLAARISAPDPRSPSNTPRVAEPLAAYLPSGPPLTSPKGWPRLHVRAGSPLALLRNSPFSLFERLAAASFLERRHTHVSERLAISLFEWRIACIAERLDAYFCSSGSPQAPRRWHCRAVRRLRCREARRFTRRAK